MRYLKDRKLYETQISSYFVVKLKKVFTQGHTKNLVDKHAFQWDLHLMLIFVFNFLTFAKITYSHCWSVTTTFL